jgi:cytochrome c553
VDPATKAFAVNIRYGRSLDAYREEAEKCVLLCANCHGEVESGLRRSPPAGARYAA